MALRCREPDPVSSYRRGGNWHNGSSFPRDEQIDKLVFELRASATQRNALRKAIEDAERADRSPGESKVQVATLDYWPFSGTRGRSDDEGVLDTILKSSFKFSRRKVEFESKRTGVDDAERLVRRRFNQANVCMFETPDRSMELHTFHSPVRLTVNAVLLTEQVGRISALREDLEALLRGSRQRFEEYLAVALRPEVGYLYLKDMLKFVGLEATERLASEEPRLTLNDKSFAEKLLGAHAQAAGRTAFAIVDELTALRLVAELTHRRSVDPSVKWHPVLVLPLATQASVYLESQRSLPWFTVGLATVWRGDERLIALLDRGLTMLLAHTELVANLYFRLYELLRVEFRECLDKIQARDRQCHRRIQELQKEPVGMESLWNDGCAIQVAQYVMRLNSREPLDLLDALNLPWKHIVGRVRSMLPLAREGTESVREGRFRIAYLALEPVVWAPRDDVSRRKTAPNLSRSTIDLSVLGFVGRLLRPFQHLADPLQIVSSADEGAGGAGFNDRVEDVRVGRLETYDRARFWKYYRVPFFVPLNAVVVGDDVTRVNRTETTPIDANILRAAISPNASIPDKETLERLKRLRQRLRFIVLDAGAGSELFLQEDEGFLPATRHVVQRREPEAYVAKLIDAEKKTRSGS